MSAAATVLPPAKRILSVRVSYEEDGTQEIDGQEAECIGIVATAEVTFRHCGANGESVVQRVTSGGVSGIEAHGDPAYWREVGREELGNLHSELEAIGFASDEIDRAIVRAVWP